MSDSTILYGYMFPQKVIWDSNNMIATLPVYIPNLRMHESIVNFRAFITCLVTGSDVYTLSKDSNIYQVHARFNGSMDSSYPMYISFGDQFHTDTEDIPSQIAFKNEDVFLIEYCRGRCRITPLTNMSEVRRDVEGNYIFSDDILAYGGSYSLKKLANLLDKVSEETNRSLKIENNGDIIVPGDVKLLDNSISVKDMKDNIDELIENLQELSDIYQVVETILKAQSDTEKLLNTCVKYEGDSHVIIVDDAILSTDDSYVSILQFYNSTVEMLAEYSRNIENNFKYISDHSDAIESINLTISNLADVLQPTVEDIEQLQKTVEDLKELISDYTGDTDLSKFLKLDNNNNLVVPADIYLDGSTLGDENSKYRADSQSLIYIINNLILDIADAAKSTYMKYDEDSETLIIS